MASNNYSPYSYPYPQSSAQHYSGYQTAPAINNVSQSSRQYQPTSATSQASEYASYQAHSYGNQTAAYGAAQDDNWSGSGNGGNRETTSRAAEVLHNMSNTAYTPSNATSASQAAFTASNAPATHHYSNNTPQANSRPPSKPHNPPSSYAQSQARPRSVNAARGHTATSRALPSPAMTAGYPFQSTSAFYNQQPQRSASPAQPRMAPAKSAAMSSASQYSDYSGDRQLPSIDATRSSTTAAASSSSYNHGTTQAPAPTFQAPASNPPNSYEQGAITVDPMAVYDPWPEYHKKQEAARAQKAIEDAARAEKERIAEEEKERKEDERTRQEEEKKREDERKRQEEEDMSRLLQQSQPKETNRGFQQQAPAETSSSMSAGDTQGGPPSADMESEIRALMAKMREFNSKDPAMLARIWEEERRAKAPKSPTVPARPAPQATPVSQPAQPPQSAQPVQPVQAQKPARTAHASAAPAANLRKKASTVRESPAAAVVHPATPVISQHISRPAVPAANASARPGGNTVWPQEKKSTLASAAANYLNGQNPQTYVSPQQILGMLNSNPSYIELCEHLENKGIRLDRAAFAKNLLTAVPDVNSTSRAISGQMATQGAIARSVPIAPPAVMKRVIGTPATPIADYPSAAPSPAYPPFPAPHTSAPTISAPVAEMVPIKPELKRPANKEEAARKRDFSDLVDLTLADDDEIEPLPKRTNVVQISSTTPSGHSPPDYMDLDQGSHVPASAHDSPQPVGNQPIPTAQHARDFRHVDIVEPLDRKKALRRNTYNIKTIARDVLLACGRHPEQRQLNQHLEALRTTISVQQDADLSTLRWDIIDPGNPPRGYFRDNTRTLVDDADDEDDSDEETRGLQRSSDGTDHRKVQAPRLVEAVNPFKQKGRPGRPPRKSFGPDHTSEPSTSEPSTPARPAPKKMSASAPRAESAGVGYSAFKSATQYDASGKPIPKKRGRPVGWRKNIHGSAQAQSNSDGNGHSGPRELQFKPAEPSALRNSTPREYGNDPIRIDSRSPSGPKQSTRYQAFKCKWQGCKAELHNLDTLKKHVSKVHRKAISSSGFIECHWADCATKVTDQDVVTGMRFEHHKPKSFTTIAGWMQHLEQLHFSPLSWELGDGPASGVSGLHNHPHVHPLVLMLTD